MTLTEDISYKGLAIWFVCALFFLYEFLLRTILGTFQNAIMSELHLSPITFALLSSTAYQIIYSLMQIPVGFLTQRYGLKRTLSAAVIICVISELGFAFSSTFYTALLFRTFMGFGSSFGFVCLLVAVYDWMPRKNIAFFIGLSQFVGTLGPMLAAGPLSALSTKSIISWREIFIFLAIAGFFLALFVFLIVDNNQEVRKKPSSLPHEPLLKNLRQFIHSKQIWFIALFSACVYFSLEYLSENEGKYFLMQKGFSANFSAYMLTVAWLGYALGCPLLGYISDKIKRRKSLMLMSALFALIALSAIIYFPLNHLMISLCFLFLGFGAASQSLGFAIMAEQCSKHHLAIGLGFNNAMIGLFAAINAPLIGVMLFHDPVYQHLSLIDYQQAFLILIIFLIVAVIFAGFFIRETFCQSRRETSFYTKRNYIFGGFPK